MPRSCWKSAIHMLDYEDGALQRMRTQLAFTLADFVACDGRYAARFAAVLADGSSWLHKAIVAGELIGEARRCLESWRSLQEWAHKAPAAVEEEPAAVAEKPDELIERAQPFL